MKRVPDWIKFLYKGWLLSFAGFGFIWLIFIGQLAWGGAISWAEAWNMAARDWLPWTVLAPFILLFVKRLPIARRQWKLALPAHLLCAALTIALCTWWAESMAPSRPLPARGARILPLENADRSLRRPPPGFRPGAGGPPMMFLVFVFRLPVYLVLVSIAHALHFYRQAEEREKNSLELEASLARARLEALQMQLQPHFLFNSLNAIAELMHSNPGAAEEMLVALSDLLRLALESSGEQELPLRRELEFVDRYLAIEQVRFGDRLNVKCEIAPGAQDALVPTFLLQPLVENAVKHGLEPRRQAGLLTIRARREAASLHVSVSDNGAGPGEKEPHERIGLGNTRARLRALYGGTATLELRQDAGFTVEITLPYHTAA